ncbi:nucleoside-diphosphate sugar epimerase/dehydratase [Aeromonas hydrophila]|uniref:nucleoside-diphosphate sugar epimerase/dehydratase n=1 Tax=Aeromonas hydrophila TaxID=644 RepID=UPI00111933F2|nr:nucleoside-diphosphate sugar epimerase/dehydratase [Aeromonas hydrophila]EIS3737976.1 polysaccharide biosynthesis protein [Aeromonas hydrophila]ELA9381559.1 polysaccharide biosynthesis protein [Aeromonas hydrophila]
MRDELFPGGSWLLTCLGSLSRTSKRAVSVTVDMILITMTYWGAYWIRLEHSWPIDSPHHWALLGAIIIVSIGLFVRLGLYRAVLRYVSFRVLWTILLGAFLSTCFFVISAFYFDIFLPRTVSVIYLSFLVLLVGGVRLFFRALLNTTRLARTQVLIYGAGSSGRQLQVALLQGNEFYPVAFVDDDPGKQGCVIQGCTVYHSAQLPTLIELHGVQKILLAIPSSTRARRQEVIKALEPLSCEVLSIPGMADLVNGSARIDQLNEVSIDDLLGRDPVEPVIRLMEANITGKAVMVTGAGGSIGSELCRQILRCHPSQLVLFELSEYALYDLHKNLSEQCQREGIATELIPLLGSVQRQHRLKTVMQSFLIQTVYHAAAYKHVPLVEFNIIEGVRNNVFGTLYAAQAAIEAGVETFVLISTDKAVRPTNTMGASKRMAELVLQALTREKHQTRFCMVRFGNVLGSSGSVVPLFRQQIDKGGPITLTHPDIIRYFMTIPEAAQLVIQAGAMGEGGDVFVLDMGQPVRIMELAKRMIRLSGLTLRDELRPDGDIAIEVTGLRPGEKLYEELLIGDDARGTEHSRIMVAQETWLPWLRLRPLLASLDDACHRFDHQQVRDILMNAPAAFEPTDGICDLVWLAKQHTFTENIVKLPAHNVDFLLARN